MVGVFGYWNDNNISELGFFFKDTCCQKEKDGLPCEEPVDNNNNGGDGSGSTGGTGDACEGECDNLILDDVLDLPS